MTDCLSEPLWNMLFSTSRKSMWTSVLHGALGRVNEGISWKKDGEEEVRAVGEDGVGWGGGGGECSKVCESEEVRLGMGKWRMREMF